MNGIVNGGWEFVWAAYAVSAVVFVAYCANVINGYLKARVSQERSAKGLEL
jgi:hypothetical protein